MCGHYLVDPVACTPASGWEKGQVENQVGVVRRRFFVPRPKFKSYAELNAWLEDRCVAWAKTNPHQELRDRTIWDVFQDERASLVPYVGPFDGFHAVPASVSKTCLVRFDKNRYSVDGRAVAACAEALSERVPAASVVINILARHREPPPPLTIDTPEALRLTCEPVADCKRYDSLRRPNHGKITGAGRVVSKTRTCTMSQLKLYGMKAAYDEIITTAVKRQHEPQQIVGDLLNAEISESEA